MYNIYYTYITHCVCIFFCTPGLGVLNKFKAGLLGTSAYCFVEIILLTLVT